MTADQWIKIFEVLAWPVTVVVLLFLLRNAVAGAISRLKGVEGPAGWKLMFEVKKVGERLQKIEEMTTDIYNLSGRSAVVRDEIFGYVADILNNKVSPQTAKEMRTELNKYHIPHLGVTVSELKAMLERLGYYKRTESERERLSDDIGPQFLEAIYMFQKHNNMADVDGVIGPKTLDLLEAELETHNKANPADSQTRG